MSISMRDLFSRHGINNEVISLRNSLLNHPDGLSIGLREAHRRLTTPLNGNGYARGCRTEDSVKIDYGIGDKKIGGVLPEWVPVSGNTVLVSDHRTDPITFSLRPDYAGETLTVEGILTKSKVASSDFPFQPWHSYYDWNFHVRFDPQYKYLYSPANHNDNIECEWDTAFLPRWALPQVGQRVWIVGRWIYDCGHPENNQHRSELHPPKAVASFRTEAVKFPENRGLTRANNAILYIGRNGGYWHQPINDQDYAFDLYLPPKPYGEAVPVWKVASKTGSLPVQPQITPYPAGNPRVLRVVIPLQGVNPHPNQYGAIISGGWSDPRGTESAKIKRLRVTVEKFFRDANLDSYSSDEWYEYVGINGRWRVWESRGGGDSETLNYSVNLDLHPDDRIHITACGFEADPIHDLMGKRIGLSWAEIVASGGDSTQAKNSAKKIRDGFLSLGSDLLGGGGIENDKISTFSIIRRPQATTRSLISYSEERDYRLQYKIELL